jgi:hypothetical protein
MRFPDRPLQNVSVLTTVYYIGTTFFVPAFDHHFDENANDTFCVVMHVARSYINDKNYIFYCKKLGPTTSSNRSAQYSEVLVFRLDDETGHLTDVASRDDIATGRLFGRYVTHDPTQTKTKTKNVILTTHRLLEWDTIMPHRNVAGD